MNDPTTDTYPFVTQSETSIAVSGTSSNTIVIGWNDLSNQGMGYGRSTDGGTSWADRGPAPAQYISDPLIASDRNGDFFMGGVAIDGAGNSFIGVSRSTNGGLTFGTPSVASDNGPSFFTDKPEMAIDRTTGAYSGRIYVCWTLFQTNRTDTFIRISYSTDHGATWSTPKYLSEAYSQTQGCALTVDGNGTVYAAWFDIRADSIAYGVSNDGGASFTSQNDPATVPHIGAYGSAEPPPVTAACNTEALNGNVRYLPFPSLAGNPSGGAYATWGTFTASSNEVMFSSYVPINGSWLTPTRVNAVTTNDQFMPRIAASSSAVEVIWYDRRDSPDNTAVDIYANKSTSGGSSWVGEKRVTAVSSPLPVLSPNFDCRAADCYFGDYIGLVAKDSSTFVGAWGDTRTSASGSPCTQGGPTTSPDPNIRALVGMFDQCDNNCDDGNPCTTDTCDVNLGCRHQNNTLTCDDGNPCTTGDHCSGGTCSGSAVNCGDNDLCTIDACDPTTGVCTHTPKDCSDGNVCNGTETCQNGNCIAGTPLNCNDGNACTADSCNAGTGCVHTAISCDDGVPCTADACDPAHGCTHTCNQGTTCAVGCDGGYCTPSGPLGCMCTTVKSWLPNAVSLVLTPVNSTTTTTRP